MTRCSVRHGPAALCAFGASLTLAACGGETLSRDALRGVPDAFSPGDASATLIEDSGIADGSTTATESGTDSGNPADHNAVVDDVSAPPPCVEGRTSCDGTTLLECSGGAWRSVAVCNAGYPTMRCAVDGDTGVASCALGETAALFLDGCGGACGITEGELGAMVAAFAAGGATRVDIREYPLDTPSSLQEYRLVVLAVPQDGISAAFRTELVAFHQRQGGLVLLGEQPQYFEPANQVLDDLLVSLGLDQAIRFLTTVAGSGGCHVLTTEVSGSNNLMTGVAGIKWSWGGTLAASEDAVLFRTDAGILGAASGNVAVVADASVFQEFCSFDGSDNEVFFRNLWDRLPLR